MISSSSQAVKVAKTQGGIIAGVVAAIPSQIIQNNYFEKNFSKNEIQDVVKVIGVNQRRWVSPNQSTTSLCFHAGQRLIKDLSWDPSSIDAIIFVTQTPNFTLPASAYNLQNAWGLSSSTIAFDVNLGCSGYPYALWLGFNLIQTGAASRVLLAVGDTISSLIDPNDRATALLFGDAGTVTALESSNDGAGSFIFGSDGSGADKIIAPIGAGMNRIQQAEGVKNKFLQSYLSMDGAAVFNFTLKNLPELIASTIANDGGNIDTYDYYLFHQANEFILKHIMKKMKLPADKVPINIGSYGNTSSASIPLLMATNLRHIFLARSTKLAAFGFGVGFSWASASLSVPPLKVVEMIEV